jgi:hypothetical protein
MARRNTIHAEPSGGVPENAPKDVVALEFARRLQAAMAAKGWNQSDLAREATKFMPPGKAVNRDNVSVYVNMRTLPGRERLEAMAKALSVAPTDLLPNSIRPAPKAAVPTREVKDLGGGRVWFRVNQEVSWPTAIKILQMLEEESRAH